MLPAFFYLRNEIKCYWRWIFTFWIQDCQERGSDQEKSFHSFHSEVMFSFYSLLFWWMVFQPDLNSPPPQTWLPQFPELKKCDRILIDSNWPRSSSLSLLRILYSWNRLDTLKIIICYRRVLLYWSTKWNHGTSVKITKPPSRLYLFSWVNKHPLFLDVPWSNGHLLIVWFPQATQSRRFTINSSTIYWQKCSVIKC